MVLTKLMYLTVQGILGYFNCPCSEIGNQGRFSQRFRVQDTVYPYCFNYILSTNTYTHYYELN